MTSPRLHELKATAEELVIGANNERHDYESIQFAFRTLMRTLDRTAARCAKARADWVDDPEDENYADWHAAADVQYPAEGRRMAARELLKSFLVELELGNIRL